MFVLLVDSVVFEFFHLKLALEIDEFQLVLLVDRLKESF